MDTSLRSLKDAFKNVALRARYNSTQGIYAFILVTPSDKFIFQELVGSYEEIHWVTGKYIRVIGPSITVNNQRVPRERVAEFITSEFSKEYFLQFKRNQTRESYEFARFIDLPENNLPAIVFFDKLINPTEYAVWKIDFNSSDLITLFRSLATHLNEICCWRDIEVLQELEKHGSAKLRTLESKLQGQKSRINNRKERLQKSIDIQDQQAFSDAIKQVEYRLRIIAKKIEAEKNNIYFIKEKLECKIKKAIPILDAIYHWNSKLISKYSIVDNTGMWSSTIAAANEYDTINFDFKEKIGLRKLAMEVFISYSHKDEDLREELDIHLSNLKQQGKIAAWHDRAIEAGAEWEAEIKGRLESAHLILLLISPRFMASKYCYDKEMQRAMERHEAGTARVIPIILKPVDWKDTPFSKLQVLPRDGKPITTWNNQDEAFLNVVEGIRQSVESRK